MKRRRTAAVRIAPDRMQPAVPAMASSSASIQTQESEVCQPRNVAFFIAAAAFAPSATSSNQRAALRISAVGASVATFVTTEMASQSTSRDPMREEPVDPSAVRPLLPLMLLLPLMPTSASAQGPRAKPASACSDSASV